MVLALGIPFLLRAYTFESDGIYYNFGDSKSYVKVTNGPQGSHYEGNIVIPDIVEYEGVEYEVREIGEWAFYQSNTPSVTLPSTCSVIKYSAFQESALLEEIILNEGLTEIGENAFSNCINLKSVSIPGSVQKIGQYAFFNCDNLKSAKISEGLTTIEEALFANCFSLSEVELPSTVTHIGKFAFHGCESLPEIELPENLNTLGVQAFCFCYELKSVKFRGTLKYIDIYCFNDCYNLVDIKLPDTLIGISYYAFYNCKSLPEIIIPDSVYEIGDYAFSECHSLHKVVLGSGLRYVYSNAFQNDPEINYVECKALTPPQAYPDTFDSNIYASASLIVDESSVDKYKETEPWKWFYQINGEGQYNLYVALEDWLALKALEKALVEMGWNSPWFFTNSNENSREFQGVLIEDGHVVELDFSYQRLNGSLPMEMIAFKNLRKLDVSDNSLEFDLSLAAQYMALYPDLTKNISYLDISYNRFYGNIGAFAACLPNLEYLDASYNNIDGLSPAISPKVTYLDVSKQYISSPLVIKASQRDYDVFPVDFPEVITYNHTNQTYGNNEINLYLGNADLWFTNYPGGIKLSGNGDNNILFASSGSRVWGNYYRIDDGYMDYMGQQYIEFEYEPGDADFSGGINIADLEAILLHIFNDYEGLLFNYYGADLNYDGYVNVQDMVVMINNLLEMDVDTSVPTRMLEVDDNSASIFIHNGSIYIDSPVEIGALHLSYSGEITFDMDKFGFNVASKNGKSVIYSFDKSSIPAGCHVIGKCESDVEILGAIAADTRANTLKCNNMDATSISSIFNEEMENENIEIYNLQGVRLNGLQKGVNIIVKGTQTHKVIIPNN